MRSVGAGTVQDSGAEGGGAGGKAEQGGQSGGAAFGGLGADPAYFKHLSVFWTDLLHLMSSKPQALTSVGPMRNFAENAKAITTEILAANEDLVEFNKALATYYKQLSDTWVEAQKKVNAKVPKIPNDLERFEAYKRVWVDMFDNDFTELFDSKEFGNNYGKLVSRELDLTKHWNNVTAVMLRSANLPSKKDMLSVYKEMHALRRRIAKLEVENRGLKAGAAGQEPEPEAREAGQEPEPEAREAGQEPEPEAREAGQEPEPEAREAGQEPEPEAGQEPEPEAGQEPEPEAGQEPEPEAREAGAAGQERRDAGGWKAPNASEENRE